MATKMYVQQAEPMLAIITLDVLKRTVSKAVVAAGQEDLPAMRVVSDFVQDGEHLMMLALVTSTQSLTYILVTCICEDDNRKALQDLNKTAPFDDSNRTSICHRIAFRKVVYYKYHEVSNRYQRDNAGVF